MWCSFFYYWPVHTQKVWTKLSIVTTYKRGSFMTTIEHEVRQLAEDEFLLFITDFTESSQGAFHVTLVKESGQGYNVVFHDGGSNPKVRVALMAQGASPMVSSTWTVRDLVESALAKGGQFDEQIRQIVDSTLMGSLGSVLLRVQHGKVVSAHFHEREIWP
jgi:hypothetical protein